MQADILKNIDILAEMAESSNDIDTLKAELKEIKKEGNSLKKELDFLNDIIGEEKYFRASERQVDENIKVSLEAKIQKQEKAIEQLKEELATALNDEQKLHQQIETVKTEIATSKEYIAVLKNRISNSKDEQKTQYEELLKNEEQALEQMNNDLNNLQNEYEKITEKINYLNLAKEEMNKKLDNEKSKLNDTKASLINPTAYIDYDLKKIDDNRIASIKKRLHDLDKRRLEIITDPIMIADEAKNLILEDDRTGALSKVKELVTIVKTKPYMDIPSSNDLENLLKEELVNASDKRDEFAALIETKDYANSNNEIIKSRIEFLQNEINKIQNQIAFYEQEVTDLDDFEFNVLKTNISNTQNKVNELIQQIVMYEEIIAADDADKTPRRKAILNASLNKKQEELETAKEIIKSYQEEEKALILKTNRIIEETITNLKDKIAKYNEEISALNKKNINDTKDILELESDKRKLKELDDVVKSIKNRQKYTRTPSEIYDEIEIYFGTIDEVPTAPEKEIEVDNDLMKDPIEPVLNYDYQDIPSYEFDIPLEEKSDDQPIEETEDLEVDPVTVLNNLPSDETIETTGERKKVINVEELNNNESSETSDEPDFVIGDYKDDDYLDMSTILNDNEVA